jgi:hypothetical protein
MHGAAVASSPLAVGGQRAHLSGGRGRRALRAAAAVHLNTNNNGVNNNRVGCAHRRRIVVVRAQSIQEPETASAQEALEAWSEDDIDKIEFAAPDAADATAIGNKDGAGATWVGLALFTSRYLAAASSLVHINRKMTASMMVHVSHLTPGSDKPCSPNAFT